MQPRTVTVTGSFVWTKGGGVTGCVEFMPSRLWVFVNACYWATLAPHQVLSKDGSFCVQVTPTDADSVMWYYWARTPAGIYRVHIPYDVNGYTMRELINEHRPWSGSPDRR
jgi:hypothetical protein